MLTQEQKTKVSEVLQNTPHTSEPWVGHIPPGKFVRQGDLFFVSVKEIKLGKPRDDYQLAPGVSKGSRHVLQKSEGVNLFESCAEHVLHGPIFTIREGCVARVTHPTHREFRIHGPATIRVEFQRDLSDIRQYRRITD